MNRFAAGFLGLVMLSSGSALADTTQIFNVSGNFLLFPDTCPDGCVSGSVTGTELIDTTVGTIVGSNLKVDLLGATYLFSGAPSYQGAQIDSAAPDDPDETPFAYAAYFSNGSHNLALNLSIDGSLAGYGGGVICSFAETGCGGGNTQYFSSFDNSNYLNDGALSPGAAVTPEPSSLMLLGTGVFGIAAAARRRLHLPTRCN